MALFVEEIFQIATPGAHEMEAFRVDSFIHGFHPHPVGYKDLFLPFKTPGIVQFLLYDINILLFIRLFIVVGADSKLVTHIVDE